MKNYDSLIAVTMRKYTKNMMKEMGYNVDSMTAKELDDVIKNYLDAPYRCGECGQMVK